MITHRPNDTKEHGFARGARHSDCLGYFVGEGGDFLSKEKTFLLENAASGWLLFFGE